MRLRTELRLGTVDTASRCKCVALDLYFLLIDSEITEGSDLFFWNRFISPYHTHCILDGEKTMNREANDKIISWRSMSYKSNETVQCSND